MKQFIILILFGFAINAEVISKKRIEISGSGNTYKLFLSVDKGRLIFETSDDKEKIDAIKIGFAYPRYIDKEYLPKKGKISFSLDLNDLVNKNIELLPCSYEIIRDNLVIEKGNIDLPEIFHKNSEFKSIWDSLVEKHNNESLNSCQKYVKIAKTYFDSTDASKEKIAEKYGDDCRSKHKKEEDANNCIESFTSCLGLLEPK